MNNAPHGIRQWAKTADGDHHPCCEWRPDEETRMAALWLKFWKHETELGRLPEMQMTVYCGCGNNIEFCPCELQGRV